MGELLPPPGARGWRQALLALLVGGCQEYTFTSNRTVDAFQQRAVNAVDLLVVIDNSCSMVEEQDNVARNFDGLIGRFQEADVDWRIAVTTTDTESDDHRGQLVGGDDEIIVRGPLGEIDRVRYDRSWPFTRGVSLQLGAERAHPLDNDDPAAWCPSTAPAGDGLGTPGADNDLCDPEAERAPLPPGRDHGPRAPAAGDLLVTEIMAQSPGLDSECDWFELRNLSPSTLSLEGIEIHDLGADRVALGASAIPPGGYAVLGRSDAGCGVPTDVALDGFSLNDDVRIIGPTTPDAAEIFGEMVAQGTSGTGIEMGLEAARLVFEEPYYTDDNEGWLREDASLSILFVSDEDDLSPRPVHEYVRAFTDLKGDEAYRDRRLVNLSAVVATDPPPRDGLPSCSSPNGHGWYGERYLEVAAGTDGLVESICAPDFAPIVSDLGLTLSGLEVEFGLSRVPRLSTLAVAIYATDDEDSKLEDLILDVDYAYLADGNRIRFTGEQVPPSEHWIVAEYEIAPTGAGTDVP